MLHTVHALDAEETRLLEEESFRSLLGTVSSEKGIEAVNPEDCLFFDIETTGLSSDTSFVFLIGCICSDGTCWYLHQFFIRLVHEEKELLSSFLELAGTYRVLVHFNGTTFDLPFLRGRAAANHLEDSDTVLSEDERCSIDLYQHFRPLRRKLQLAHMNQSFLEQQADWMREDTLSGREVVTRFWAYAAAAPDKQPELQALLLKHNHDDLAGMLHVLKLEAYLALFSGRIASNVIAEESGNQTVLNLRFQLQLPLPKPIGQSVLLSDGAQCFLHADAALGTLQIPFYTGTLRYFISDYKNYYYLPFENQIVHKSVASYVAKEYREKARPDNCFVEKEGRFLPLPKLRQRPENERDRSLLSQPPFAPVFRESYESKEHYFEYNFTNNSENHSKNDSESVPGGWPEALTLYTRLLLRQIFR
ncbi:MAG: ribonuclease H-like domain-containing protein [Lachnospiraceae bacterium]|nr:ribonuclease H-like domain-containing protein [Lachnospiraceae bacterium]